LVWAVGPSFNHKTKSATEQPAANIAAQLRADRRPAVAAAAGQVHVSMYLSKRLSVQCRDYSDYCGADAPTANFQAFPGALLAAMRRLQ